MSRSATLWLDRGSVAGAVVAVVPPPPVDGAVVPVVPPPPVEGGWVVAVVPPPPVIGGWVPVVVPPPPVEGGWVPVVVPPPVGASGVNGFLVEKTSKVSSGGAPGTIVGSGAADGVPPGRLGAVMGALRSSPPPPPPR